MAERQPKKPTATATEVTSSAPELPAALAKQYGLHHRVSKKGTNATPAATSKALATDTEPDTETAQPAETATPELAILTDPKTDAAVDAIVATESDELLAAEDALQKGEVGRDVPKAGFWRRVGHFFKAWATSPRARWATVIVLFGLAVATAFIPQSRYFVLNTAGVRSSTSVVIVDNATRLPLKNVTVQIGTQKTHTNIDGQARFSNLRLGPQSLVIKRLAFKTITKQVTIGWGSNPQDTLLLSATGLQYTIDVCDYVSDLPLADAEVSADGLNALSDKKGIITFTVSDQDPKDIVVTVTKKGYRNEKHTLHPGETKANKVRLVPAGKAFYVSKQSGRYDLYSSDIDGSAKKVILAGSGDENATISLAVAPAGDWAAMVATRDTARSKDGYVLRSITLVNYDGSTVSTLERAEQIQLIDWVGTKVIYQVTVAGTSAANSQRSRLIAYDYTTNSRVQLATANHFNAVHLLGGSVYYAVAASDPAAHPAFIKVRLDGSGRQIIWDKEVWTVWRTSPSSLSLQTVDGWAAYSGSGTPIPNASVPASGRQYAENPEAAKTAWIDIRDGKGVVLVTDIATGKEKQVAGAEGITYPLRWLGNTTLLYRVAVNGETADYIVSSNGGQSHKITDVTNTYGFTRY